MRFVVLVCLPWSTATGMQIRYVVYGAEYRSLLIMHFMMCLASGTGTVSYRYRYDTYPLNSIVIADVGDIGSA